MKGPGHLPIRDHIAHAGLRHVYLGYWVGGSSRMACKAQFRALERLGRDGWRRVDEVAAEPPGEDPIVLPTRRDRGRLLIDA